MGTLISKIKSWLGWIAGGVIALLATLLGIERMRRKKAQTETAEAKAETAVVTIEKESQEAVSEAVSEVCEKLEEVEQSVEEVKADNPAYNDIIDAWNSGKL